jgi:hypothetical protein
MTTEELIGENSAKVAEIRRPSKAVGRWLSSLFGCHHKEMSRPFSRQGQTYRTCMECGARREFNLKTWETRGKFYYGLPGSKRSAGVNHLAMQ